MLVCEPVAIIAPPAGSYFYIKDKMNRLITKKPPSDQKLKFAPMGAKPEKPENEKTEPKAADSAKSEAKEAAAENKKPIKKTNRFAKKAATALAGKG